MTRYLVAIHHPDDYDPSIAEDEAMSRDIDALNDEMVAAGIRIFVGGLHPAIRSTATCRLDGVDAFAKTAKVDRGRNLDIGLRVTG